MKEMTIKAGEMDVTVAYRPAFVHCVEIKFINPFEGFIDEPCTDQEESNFFDPKQAEPFVEESVRLLVKQIQNVIKYRSVYQSIHDDYKHITDIMFAALKAMDMSDREKFKYHIELQSKVREEMFSLLRTKIPEINESNQDEFLIFPSILSKILAVI